MSKRPNLVIGAVRGYSFAQLEPFVVSLKRSSFEGDLVLLWNSLSGETLADLSHHGVKLVPFSYRGSGSLNSWSRFWPWIRPLIRLPVGRALRNFIYEKILNLAFVRYLHALTFLEAHRGEYQKIFLTDVRDILFQDDPFRMALPGDISAFLESPQMQFGREPLNDGWLEENYGPEMKTKLSGKRISCCGTVMGTEAGMLDYLRAFIAEIARLKSVAHGADTSVHNVLVREVLADRMAVADNLENAVGTINPMTEFIQDAEGRVLGPGGEPVPILHQYDRQPGLSAALIRQLADESPRPIREKGRDEG